MATRPILYLRKGTNEIFIMERRESRNGWYKDKFLGQVDSYRGYYNRSGKIQITGDEWEELNLHYPTWYPVKGKDAVLYKSYKYHVEWYHGPVDVVTSNMRRTMYGYETEFISEPEDYLLHLEGFETSEDLTSEPTTIKIGTKYSINYSWRENKTTMFKHSMITGNEQIDLDLPDMGDDVIEGIKLYHEVAQREMKKHSKHIVRGLL